MNKILVRKVRVEDLKKVAEIQVTSWKTAYEGIVANEYLKSLSIDEKYQKRLKAYKEDGTFWRRGYAYIPKESTISRISEEYFMNENTPMRGLGWLVFETDE